MRMDFMTPRISGAKNAVDRLPDQADGVRAHTRMGGQSKQAPGQLSRIGEGPLAGHVRRNVRDLFETAAVKTRGPEPPGVECGHERRAQALVPSQQWQT